MLENKSAALDCQSCGACCATFRVSFYWSETDAHPLGQVPQAMTKSISLHHAAMLGTTTKPPRCIALRGVIGEFVACNIYDQRSSTCREFEAGTDDCLKAREMHGISANKSNS